MKIKCDKCEHTFKLSVPSTTTIDNDIEWTYFTCPHCGEQYSCYYKDRKVRELEKEKERWVKQTKNPNLKKHAIEKANQIQKEIESEMKKLKEKLG